MPGSRLCLVEREEIRVGLAQHQSIRRIAGRLGRSPSTIWREVKANGGPDRYRAVAAQDRAEQEARRPKPYKLASDPELASAVTELLRIRYSPQTCVQILSRRGMRVSHETIYRACYEPGRGLDPQAWKWLPRRRQRRKHAGRKWGFASTNPLGEPTSVHRRHPIALTRTQSGHLEGDLLIGQNNRSAVLVLSERATRYTFLASLPHGYGTEPLAHALYQLLEDIPPPMRRTLTWDQGREMKYWADVQAATGTLIYFCDPHSPWQRPTVENNNGILRRWLPKGTPLNPYTQTDLDHIAHLINQMPRQIHHWASAQDLYHHHLVATTT
jgi:IS30 family transposase